MLRSLALRITVRGWQQFNVTNLGGDPRTKVEFAPAVESALFLEPISLLQLSFTSAIDPASCDVKVEVSSDTRMAISTNKPEQLKDCDAGGVFVQFSGDPALLSADEWGGAPSALKAKYGQDQSSWPWYIKVKVKAKAPNNVKLIGNQGAAKKFIWPNPTDTAPQISPYLYGNGTVGSGGNEFEIWLPVAPSMACCMPNIQWRSTGPSSPPQPIQNGCTCADSVGKAFCFVGACVSGNSTVGYSTNQAPGMQPAECDGSYQRFDGEWHLWHDCCSVSIDGVSQCDQYASFELDPPKQCSPGDIWDAAYTWYQHIPRPWDQSRPQQCKVITTYGGCAEH